MVIYSCSQAANLKKFFIRPRNRLTCPKNSTCPKIWISIYRCTEEMWVFFLVLVCCCFLFCFFFSFFLCCWYVWCGLWFCDLYLHLNSSSCVACRLNGDTWWQEELTNPKSWTTLHQNGFQNGHGMTSWHWQRWTSSLPLWMTSKTTWKATRPYLTVVTHTGQLCQKKSILFRWCGFMSTLPSNNTSDIAFQK